MGTAQKQQRPHFRERFVESAYRMLADDLRPKPPPAPAAAAPADAPGEVSLADIQSLVGG